MYLTNTCEYLAVLVMGLKVIRVLFICNEVRAVKKHFMLFLVQKGQILSHLHVLQHCWSGLKCELLFICHLFIN